jgi:hypothetical protein
MSLFSFPVARLATALLCASSSCAVIGAVPHVAYADATSSIAGVKLPRGAAAFDGITDRYKALLTALSAEKEVGGLSPTGAEPEVFIWKGSDYREDRTSLTRGNFASALSAAGYEVKEVSSNDLRDVNIFTHFPAEEEGLAFHPGIWKVPGYIVAQNNAKGRAFVAAWLESENAMTLGILPVEFKAPRGPAKWPALAANAVLIKNPRKVAASLPAPRMPTFAPLAPKPGTARGWLKDGSGRPIAGAEVVVESSYGGGFRTHHTARSNAQGLYQVMVPKGIARVVSAEATRTYNGQKFELPLDAVRGETRQFDSARGGVENFVLRTSGEQGGVVRLTNNLPDKSEVELTLVPQGPLLDGSTGKTLVYRYTSSPYDETYLVGLPIGRYLFSAKINDEGDILPIRVAQPFGSESDQAKRASMVVNFESGYTYSTMAQANRGVAHFQITMTP